MGTGNVSTRSMTVRPLEIDGSFLVTAQSFGDDRGDFFESYREDVLIEALGYAPRIMQTNISTSCRNGVRGVHGAATPPGLAKLVNGPRGTLMDFGVDGRRG